jgi:hypothetical protein
MAAFGFVFKRIYSKPGTGELLRHLHKKRKGRKLFNGGMSISYS